MHITILNGDMNSNSGHFSIAMDHFSTILKEENEVDHYKLNEMNLHYCTGCWDCWWKIPGRCKLKDDGEQIFRSVINSGFFIFASPLYAGFTSSALKKITDRLIVLIHPYLQLRNNESHHRKRYDRYPDFGVIIKKEKGTDEEDIQIIKDIYDRFAINFHCTQKYFIVMDEARPSELVNATLT